MCSPLKTWELGRRGEEAVEEYLCVEGRSDGSKRILHHSGVLGRGLSAEWPPINPVTKGLGPLLSPKWQVVDFGHFGWE